MVALAASGAPRPLVVVFDLDGTLIDSAGDLQAAVNEALLSRGLPVRSLAEVRSFVGDGSRKLLERAAGGDTGLDELLAIFGEYYCKHSAVHTTLLPGAISLLDELKGRHRLALCTNKPRELTAAVLSAFQLGEVFEVVVAGGDCPRNKPDPAPLQLVAERLGVPTDCLVMVGDGPQDVSAARSAGARSVGLTDNVLGHFVSLVQARPDALVPLRYVGWLLRQWATMRS